MKIDREEARRIAALAHIAMDDAALERSAGELTKILTYVDQLRQVEADEAGAGEDDVPTPLREDVPRAPLDRDLIERNAPSWSEGFFVVPKVIGE